MGKGIFYNCRRGREKRAYLVIQIARLWLWGKHLHITHLNLHKTHKPEVHCSPLLQTCLYYTLTALFSMLYSISIFSTHTYCEQYSSDVFISVKYDRQQQHVWEGRGRERRESRGEGGWGGEDGRGEGWRGEWGRGGGCGRDQGGGGRRLVIFSGASSAAWGPESDRGGGRDEDCAGIQYPHSQTQERDFHIWLVCLDKDTHWFWPNQSRQVIAGYWSSQQM